MSDVDKNLTQKKNSNVIKVICAIANHGIKNQCYLDQLLREYRSMPIDIDIVVLSDIEKDLGDGVEVIVGAPTNNPWSLPFSHRNLFIERQNNYDYFIYSEDDTLLTWTALKSFIDSIDTLEANEIAGFMRVETGPKDEKYFSTCHSFFRWIPSTVRKRGGKLWARYSNEHAACYVISRDQLRNAISSGAFPTEPHEGRHDMLCAAATDVYTKGNVERIVCIDNLNDFTLPHLPNKYIGKMGLPADEMAWQVNALHKIYKNQLPDYELLNPETMLPGSIGSKNYREQPDPFLNNILGETSKKILVWGAGDGVLELELKKNGHHIYIIPLDAVVGESCIKRGLTVLSPDALDKKDEYQFDIVVLNDVLHLLDDPGLILNKMHNLLVKGGMIVIRVPNLNDVRLLKKRFRDPRFKMSWEKKVIGVEPYNFKSLNKVVNNAGFSNLKSYTNIPREREKYNIASFNIFSTIFSPYLYLTGNVK